MLLDWFHRTRYISYPSRFAERFDVRMDFCHGSRLPSGSDQISHRAFVLVPKSDLRTFDARDIYTATCIDVKTKTEHLKLMLPVPQAAGLAMEIQTTWVSGWRWPGVLIALIDRRVYTRNLGFSGHVACSTAAGHQLVSPLYLLSHPKLIVSQLPSRCQVN